MKRRRKSRLLPTLLLLLGAAGPLGADGLTFWSPLPAERLVEALVGAMTDEELLGQVFFLGYIGTRPSEEIRRWIAERHIGGVKVFTRNVETLPALAEGIREMQRLSQRGGRCIPLFVATDQEGGWVRHIKAQTSETPGNLALGAAGVPQDAYLTGYYIGRELAALGINMDFAPTVDVYSNPDASVIGPRAFSSDPVRTGLLGIAWFKGLARSGVVALAKHFPGHGHAARDSHGALPVIRISYEQMWDRELLPYRMLIPEGLPGIMSGHLAYPRILGDMTPSSCSPFFLQEVLRDRLGFQGIVVTDDMEMNAVLAGGIGTPEASRRALEAGNDMVLISHTPRVQEESWWYLLRRLRRDAAFRGTVRRAAARVLRLKWATFRGTAAGGSPPFPLHLEAAKPLEGVPAPGAPAFFRESSLRSVTVIADAGLPFRPRANERILLAGQFEEFLQEGRRRWPQAQTFSFPYSPFFTPLPQVRSALLKQAAGSDTLIFCLANYNSLEILKSLRPLRCRILVVSTLTPVYLGEVPWVTASLAVYGTSRESFRAGFAALAGDFSPEGTLPLPLPAGEAR